MHETGISFPQPVHPRPDGRRAIAHIAVMGGAPCAAQGDLPALGMPIGIGKVLSPPPHGPRLLAAAGKGDPGRPRVCSMREDYCETTRSIRVAVRAFYLADQSEPERGHFVWAYRVAITNQGAEAVQLLKRSWQITDGLGRTQDVHGEGVVGEKPVLEPGQSFEYTSGTPLPTASGFMRGAYHMVVRGTGETFDVRIPAFSLDSPHQPTSRVH